jgi:lipopolysaccharide export system permease protein
VVLSSVLRCYVTGILPRYVFGQVLRAFLLALLTLTAVIVLFMVMAEATRQGLAPQAVLKLIPYVIPGTLPYTIPVALLFAVSVVYGRIAGDNEVVAAKASGCSAWVLLMPSIVMGAVFTVVLMVLSGEVIPRANHAFKVALFKDAEENFYMLLKRDREINHPKWPFFIAVKDVRDRVLIDPTFKHRASRVPGGPASYDMTIQAKTAVVRFTEENGQRMIVLDMTMAVFAGQGRVATFPKHTIPYPLPASKGLMGADKKVQEMTGREIARENAKVLRLLDRERKRQAISASLWIASGRIDRVNWPDLGSAYREEVRWRRQSNEFQTERHVRVALAFGALCFVLLGAPVGMLMAKSDFLSAFITCFLPIIVVYYPLVLMGINLGKEGIVGPWVVFAGDGVLLALFRAFALPPVLRH